jgi:hypothetical protein
MLSSQKQLLELILSRLDLLKSNEHTDGVNLDINHWKMNHLLVLSAETWTVRS